VHDAQEARAGDAQRAELAARAKQLRTQSYFEMLGVMDTSGSDEIELAYETIAKAFHPDRFNSASGAVRQLADEVFQMLSTARATLVDTKGRLEYESARRRGRRKTKEESAGERSANAETQFQVGESKLRARDYEGALVCFGKAMELNSEEGEYYAHYGWCLHLCHPDDALMVEEAIEHVRRGVRLAPDREKPYLFLGRLYKVVGRAVAAEKMFTRAVQIQSNCVEAMRELRLINLRREKSRGIIKKIFRK
jgi:curved DNA-binding protein CbpA